MAWVMQALDPNETHVVTVNVGGMEEKVHVTPDKGPVVVASDGNVEWAYRHDTGSMMGFNSFGHNTAWPLMSKTERELMIIMVAKKNKAIRETREARGKPAPSGAQHITDIMNYFKAQAAGGGAPPS
mmetsp:Transcript_69832/g.180080  ORF Transcript_69832/g.180080 Transcript_69832/m.180080 type:complete len:127 (+) Transcript_69832:86-466(+)